MGLRTIDLHKCIAQRKCIIRNKYTWKTRISSLNRVKNNRLTKLYSIRNIKSVTKNVKYGYIINTIFISSMI